MTVITPAYNAEQTLGDTVESCLAQTCRDFEMLIVDDGSADQTAAIAAAYARRDPRVIVVRQANGGISSARNTALRRSRGRYLALLDSDDLWHPEFLASQLGVLRVSSAAIVSSNAVNLGGSLDGTTVWPRVEGTGDITLHDLLEHEDSVCILSLFDRRVYEAIGGFDERLRSNEDYDYWIRAARAGFRVVANFRPLGSYRRRPDSVSADERTMIAGISAVLREVEKTLPAGAAERAIIERQLERFQRELAATDAREALQAGNARKALESLARIPPPHRSLALSAVLRLGRIWPGALRYGYLVRRAARRRPRPHRRTPSSARGV